MVVLVSKVVFEEVHRRLVWLWLLLQWAGAIVLLIQIHTIRVMMVTEAYWVVYFLVMMLIMIVSLVWLMTVLVPLPPLQQPLSLLTPPPPLLAVAEARAPEAILPRSLTVAAAVAVAAALVAVY
jgi:hypothetical protein